MWFKIISITSNCEQKYIMRNGSYDWYLCHSLFSLDCKHIFARLNRINATKDMACRMSRVIMQLNLKMNQKKLFIIQIRTSEQKYAKNMILSKNQITKSCQNTLINFSMKDSCLWIKTWGLETLVPHYKD